MSVEERLDKLEKSVKLILDKLDDIKTDTKRMDTHILFVENIYTSIKKPFHYLMNMTSFLLHNDDRTAIKLR